MTDLKFSVYGYPPIVVIALGIMFLALQFLHLRMHFIRMHLEPARISGQISHFRYLALKQTKGWFMSHGVRLSISLILSASVMIFQGLFPFFMYDLPFQRQMDIDDFVLNNNLQEKETVRYCRYKVYCKPGVDSVEEERTIIPYRSLSAAYTVMLQLCRPDVRDFHRSHVKI